MEGVGQAIQHRQSEISLRSNNQMCKKNHEQKYLRN